MIFIISPSKDMNSFENEKNITMPENISKTKNIVEHILRLSDIEFKRIMNANDKITQLNRDRYKKIRYDLNGMAAINLYSGIQYKSIDVKSFDKNDIEYLNKYIRIVSALYGIVRPLDSIYPYRLEMNSKLAIDNSKDLYGYWDKDIADTINSDIIINLASKEYSKSILKYIKKDYIFTINFKIKKGEKLVSHSVNSKKARGMMINFVVKNKVKNIEELFKFKSESYRFDSIDKNEILFIRNI